MSITHLTFGKEYTQAIEQKQVARQDAEKQKFVVDKAEFTTYVTDMTRWMRDELMVLATHKNVFATLAARSVEMRLPPTAVPRGGGRHTSLEPTSAAMMWYWQMTGAPSVPINIDRPF